MEQITIIRKFLKPLLWRGWGGLLICLAFAACKKDKGDSFDPFQYYIVATTVNGTTPVPVLSGAIVFSSAGRCLVFSKKELQPDVFDYVYINGHIKITGTEAGKPKVFADITIANEQIQNVTSETDELSSYKLDLYKRISDTNDFKNRSFGGTYYKEGSSNPAGTTFFRFDDAKWVSGNGVNDLYFLHTNAFASSPSEENRTDVFHFVVANKKLLFYNISRNTYGVLDSQS